MAISFVIVFFEPRFELDSAISCKTSLLPWKTGGTPLGWVHQNELLPRSTSFATNPESIDILPRSVDLLEVGAERLTSKDCRGGALLLGGGAASRGGGGGAALSCGGD